MRKLWNLKSSCDPKSGRWHKRGLTEMVLHINLLSIIYFEIFLIKKIKQHLP
jgi:hypothetical protein